MARDSRQAVQAVADDSAWFKLSTGRGEQGAKPFLHPMVINAPTVSCTVGPTVSASMGQSDP